MGLEEIEARILTALDRLHEIEGVHDKHARETSARIDRLESGYRTLSKGEAFDPVRAEARAKVGEHASRKLSGSDVVGLGLTSEEARDIKSDLYHALDLVKRSANSLRPDMGVEPIPELAFAISLLTAYLPKLGKP